MLTKKMQNKQANSKSEEDVMSQNALIQRTRLNNNFGLLQEVLVKGSPHQTEQDDFMQVLTMLIQTLNEIIEVAPNVLAPDYN